MRRDEHNCADGEDRSDVREDLGENGDGSGGGFVSALGGSDRSGLVRSYEAGARPPFEHAVEIVHGLLSVANLLCLVFWLIRFTQTGSTCEKAGVGNERAFGTVTRS